VLRINNDGPARLHRLSKYIAIWFEGSKVLRGWISSWSAERSWGTRWRSWLRHCATSRTVAGSIPDGVIVNFHWYNPSARTMALGSTQPLTEMSTRNTSWTGKGGRGVGLTTFLPSCSDCLEIWEPRPPGALRTCPGLQWDCFTLLLNEVTSHNLFEICALLGYYAT
jgi:hypothetical protein